MTERTVAPRLEVRLDPERRQKLAEMLEAGCGPLSLITRRGIDLAYDEFMKEQRREALERLFNANVEDVPDPDELSRQLGETYSSPLP